MRLFWTKTILNILKHRVQSVTASYPHTRHRAAGQLVSASIERYQLPGQLSCHERRVVLAAARVMLLASSGALVWSSSPTDPRQRRSPKPTLSFHDRSEHPRSIVR